MCRYGILLCGSQPLTRLKVPVAFLMPLEPVCRYVVMNLGLPGLFQNMLCALQLS